MGDAMDKKKDVKEGLQEEINDLRIRPLRGKTLIKRVEAYETTKGGIYIRDYDREVREEGYVMAIGDCKGQDNMYTPYVGQMVVFERYTGTDIDYDGKQYLLINTKDIIGLRI